MVDFFWGFGRYNDPAIELEEYPPPRSAKPEKLEKMSDGKPLAMVSQLDILLRLQTDNFQWLGSGEKGASAHVGMTSTLKPTEEVWWACKCAMWNGVRTSEELLHYLMQCSESPKDCSLATTSKR